MTEVQQRVGLSRAPVLTVVVFVITAGVNLAQFLHRPLLAELERTAAGRHDEWWRTGTALLVQDGGIGGTVSNLLFLAVLGVVAEQVVDRVRWLLAYLGAAMVGEFAGYAWQPTGGGNSIAICGLAGVVLIAMLRNDRALPFFAPFVVMLWSGNLLATAWYPLFIAGLVAAFVVQRMFVATRPVRRLGSVLGVGFALLVGVLLTLLHNIHGAAALAGLVLGCIPGPHPRPRRAPATRPA